MLKQAEIMDVFFEGALKGWVTKQLPKTTIAELPGSEVYRYRLGFYEYVDTFFVGPVGSGGFTLITHRGQPIWIMSYEGFVTQTEAIPVVRNALMTAYTTRQFLGGRGMTKPNDIGHYHYRNFIDRLPFNNDFREFSGHDVVVNIWGDDTAFRHDYRGRALVEME